MQFIHQYPTWSLTNSHKIFCFQLETKCISKIYNTLLLEAASFILIKQQFNYFWWNVLFENTRDCNGYNFCTNLRYIVNGLPWNRTICYNQKQVHSSSLYFKQNWKRFLDDYFIFLRLSLIKPTKLLAILNKIKQAIQFTKETSYTQFPFLDKILICLLQIKPPQTLLEKYPIFSCT